MQRYSGLTPEGKMILTPEFAASLRRAGCPPGPGIQVEPGYGMDSAADDELDENAALNASMNAAYARLLRAAGDGANLDETFRGITPLSADFEGRAESTRAAATAVHAGLVRTVAEEERLLAEFKQARGWDGASDEVLKINFQLERLYAEMLGGH